MRRAVGIAFATLVLLALLYPPWVLTHYADGRPPMVAEMKFAPIWKAPELDGRHVTIRTDLLALELLGVALAGTFALMATKK